MKNVYFLNVMIFSNILNEAKLLYGVLKCVIYTDVK